MINDEFSTKIIALVDSGADLNCIKEGIIPIKYFQKIKSKPNVSTADGSKIIFNYKLSDAFILNDGICLKTNLIMIKNLSQMMILGTPFLNMIQPIERIDSTGIYTVLNNKKIVFRFITDPRTKEINELKTHLVYNDKIKKE